MYAIVDIAGQQFKVEKDQEIFVHRLEGEEGSKVNFSDVLLLDVDGKIIVGTPLVKGASISAKIISHEKGDKITVFHKKRRKGYQKANGHRQYFSKIQIESIAEKGAPAEKKEAVKEAPVKEEAAKVVAEKKETVKKDAPKATAAKTETVKKAAPKTTAAKKETVKKAAPKKAAAPKAAKAKASTKKTEKE